MNGDKKMPTRTFTAKLNQTEVTFFMISRFRIVVPRNPQSPGLQRLLGYAAVPEMVHDISPSRFNLLYALCGQGSLPASGLRFADKGNVFAAILRSDPLVLLLLFQ